MGRGRLITSGWPWVSQSGGEGGERGEEGDGGRGGNGRVRGLPGNGGVDRVTANFHGDVMRFAHTGRGQGAAELGRMDGERAGVQGACARWDGGGVV
jgi:hypothetical protein